MICGVLYCSGPVLAIDLSCLSFRVQIIQVPCSCLAGAKGGVSMFHSMDMTPVSTRGAQGRAWLRWMAIGGRDVRALFTSYQEPILFDLCFGAISLQVVTLRLPSSLAQSWLCADIIFILSPALGLIPTLWTAYLIQSSHYSFHSAFQRCSVLKCTHTF